MPTLLITSFGPWGAHAENASALWWERAEVVAPAGWTLEFLELPVDWTEAPRRLFQKMDTLPALETVLLCGMAENRTAITPERFAHNLRCTHTPDVAGVCPRTETIHPQGPTAHAARLPVSALVKALMRAGVPATESRDAGTYLCNFLSYCLLERLQGTPKMRGGFIHVPRRAVLGDDLWQAAADAVVRTLTDHSEHPNRS